MLMIAGLPRRGSRPTPNASTPFRSPSHAYRSRNLLSVAGGGGKQVYAYRRLSNDAREEEGTKANKRGRRLIRHTQRQVLLTETSNNADKTERAVAIGGGGGGGGGGGVFALAVRQVRGRSRVDGRCVARVRKACRHN